MREKKRKGGETGMERGEVGEDRGEERKTEKGERWRDEDGSGEREGGEM